MANSRQIVVATALCVAVAAITNSNPKQAGQVQSLRPKSDLKRLLPKHSGIPPIAQLEPDSIESTGDQQRRLVRQRVSKGLYTHAAVVDPGMKEINGQVELIHLTFIDSVQVVRSGQIGDPPGLPISGATIVIGKIVEGMAYLNEEHTGVFSEYRVAVSEVLHSNSDSKIEAGDNINTWRAGGSVLFPSGHIEHFVIAGRGFPEIGGVYLFFLRTTDSSLSDYAISTAYALKNKTVFPIDGAGDQSTFEGASETLFLNTVRKEIAARERGTVR